MELYTEQGGVLGRFRSAVDQKQQLKDVAADRRREEGPK